MTSLRIDILGEVQKKEQMRIVDLEQDSSSHLMIALGFLHISSANVISNVTNKTSLNKYLANKLFAYHEGKQTILSCVTFGNSIISNSKALLSETEVNHCINEKADPKIIRNLYKPHKEKIISMYK